MQSETVDTDDLLRRAERGDKRAIERLFVKHLGRLRKMIAVRMDRRLAARVDPSDVVQEALAEAVRKMPAYLRNRRVAFYPWLRQIAWERLVRLHGQHIHAGRRSVRREQPLEGELSEESAVDLAGRLAASGTSPSRRMVRDEVRRRVREGLDQLAARDREVLVLRYMEQLSTAEIAAVLGITEGAVKTRHFRAIERLHRLLDADLAEND
jgi:RNA polymerase sigma-70 factor (ECF subfamily)